MKDYIKQAHKDISQAVNKGFKNLWTCWTGGKDSTVMLYMILKFIKKPKVLFLDSGSEFLEIYEFIDKYTKDWGLDLTTRYYKTTSKSLSTKKNKGEALSNTIKELKIDGVFTGIRRDEHKARIDEVVFSPRKNHIRIHPLLDWTEKNIWDYIKERKLPYISLYDKGYRSLGVAPFTKPAKSNGDERSGRGSEKDGAMEELRKMGYF